MKRNKVRVPKELVVKLFDLGAITVGPKVKRHCGTKTCFDLRLDLVLPTNGTIRLQLAMLLLKQLRFHYSDGITTRPFGLLHVSPTINGVITTVSDIITAGKYDQPTECPTASIATRMSNDTAHTSIYGKVVIGIPYTLADDILWTGDTIVSTFEFWCLHHSYPIDYVLVFCDAEIGAMSADGPNSMVARIQDIRKQSGLTTPVQIDCLINRRQILDYLKDVGKIGTDEYGLAMEGTVAD